MGFSSIAIMRIVLIVLLFSGCASMLEDMQVLTCYHLKLFEKC